MVLLQLKNVQRYYPSYAQAIQDHIFLLVKDKFKGFVEKGV